MSGSAVRLFSVSLCLTIATTMATGLPAAAAAATSAEPRLEEIVVTGSYIRRSTFDSPSPIDFVNQEDIARQGALEVKDVVQNLTYNIGSENFPDTLRSGATTGMESINLRGLGINSTLVMMNGRRQAEAPQLNNDGIAFVDTASMMPTIAIERMEILKDGAAALYGSDAISGVVNFITRSQFEGFEFSIDHQTITDYRDDRPRDWNVQGIVGFGNDRGHVTIAAQFLDRNQMPFYERDFATGTGLSGFGQPGNFLPIQGADEDPAAFAARAAAFQATTFNPASPFGADLDCANVPGAMGRTPVNFLANPTDPNSILNPGGFGESCIFDFLPTQSLLDEERRVKFFGQFDYMLVPEHDVQLYGEFHAANNEIERGNSPSFGFVDSPTIPVVNPGLRNDAFRRGLGGEELIDDAAAQALGFANAIEAAQANPLVGPMLFFGRPFSGPPETTTRDRETAAFDTTGYIQREKTHFVGGIRGNLPFLGDTWTFDIANTWSRHRSSGFAAVDTNDDNMKAALIGFGGRDCNPDAEGQLPGEPPCFFFNPYGTQFLTDPDNVGTNGLANAPAMWQHMIDPLQGESTQELWVIEAVATGDAFDLPAGPLGLAVGAQYRDQSFTSIPSGTAQNFNFSFVVGGEAFDVERDVWAVFGEVRIPVTDAGSPIGALELNAAVRHEDYGGGTGSTTDPKVSFLWTPTDDLSVRGSFQTSFKAPGLAQLGGSSTSLNNVQSNPFDPSSPSIFVPGIAIGNPNLSPEEADVVNLGLSFRPSAFEALDGLEIDLDWWYFDFSNAIRKESNAAVVAAFAAGDPAAQAKITLTPDGRIAVIRSEFINAASVETQGLDLSVRYPFEIGDLGQFGAFWNSTHITRYKFQEGPDLPVIDGKGRRNFQTIGAPAPEWRANLGLDWLLGNHSASVILRYTTDYDLGQTPSANIAALNNRTPSTKIDDQLTVDVQYSYQTPDLWGFMGPTLTIGAINLFDEDPPTIDDGPGFDSKIHDPRGRIAYARIQMQF
jgi:iron complex outermembrane recepter protein